MIKFLESIIFNPLISTSIIFLVCLFIKSGRIKIYLIICILLLILENFATKNLDKSEYIVFPIIWQAVYMIEFLFVLILFWILSYSINDKLTSKAVEKNF